MAQACGAETCWILENKLRQQPLMFGSCNSCDMTQQKRGKGAIVQSWFSVFFFLFFFLNVFIFISLNKNISAGNADPVCNHQHGALLLQPRAYGRLSCESRRPVIRCTVPPCRPPACSSWGTCDLMKMKLKPPMQLVGMQHCHFLAPVQEVTSDHWTIPSS